MDSLSNIYLLTFRCYYFNIYEVIVKKKFCVE